MLLEGRKQPRAPERFLMQISAVHDPLLTDLASVENLSPRGVRVTSGRSWELGSYVEVKSRAVELTARARVVYCQAVNAKAFVAGLDFLTQKKRLGCGGRACHLKATKVNHPAVRLCGCDPDDHHPFALHFSNAFCNPSIPALISSTPLIE